DCLEDLYHAARILLQRPHAEQDIARGSVLAARGLDLLADLAGRPASRLTRHSAGDEAGPDVPALLVLTHPPRQQLGIGLFFLPDRPVELRAEVIHPPLLEPQAGVGIQPRVGVEAFDTRRLPRPPDAERANAHLYPGLGRL